MSVGYSDLVSGNIYRHGMNGLCLFVSVHPHDGAYLIMENIDDESDDFGKFFGCERHELEKL